MARGTEIIVTSDPKGVFIEGVTNAGETPKPGQIVQLDPTQAEVEGRFVLKLYNRDADGDRPAGPLIVLLPDRLQGMLHTDAYAASQRCFGYVPQAGEELNVMFGNVSGTGDDIAKGDLLIINDGDGKVFKTTGSPECEPFMALEAIVDPTDDQLLHVIYTGY